MKDRNGREIRPGDAVMIVSSLSTEPPGMVTVDGYRILFLPWMSEGNPAALYTLRDGEPTANYSLSDEAVIYSYDVEVVDVARLDGCDI